MQRSIEIERNLLHAKKRSKPRQLMLDIKCLLAIDAIQLKEQIRIDIRRPILLPRIGINPSPSSLTNKQGIFVIKLKSNRTTKIISECTLVSKLLSII